MGSRALPRNLQLWGWEAVGGKEDYSGGTCTKHNQCHLGKSPEPLVQVLSLYCLNYLEFSVKNRPPSPRAGPFLPFCGHPLPRLYLCLCFPCHEQLLVFWACSLIMPTSFSLYFLRCHQNASLCLECLLLSPVHQALLMRRESPTVPAVTVLWSITLE